VAEDSSDGIATRALNVHEIRIGALYEARLLVLALFVNRVGMKEVTLNQRHL